MRIALASIPCIPLPPQLTEEVDVLIVALVGGRENPRIVPPIAAVGEGIDYPNPHPKFPIPIYFRIIHTLIF
jgi:hypothetical protein